MQYYFYPRSPCGERHVVCRNCETTVLFLSTLSLRRATKVSVIVPSDSLYFYPRSPCGERHHRSSGNSVDTYFYPRSPCGERQENTTQKAKAKAFLSTLSLRRATMFVNLRVLDGSISIHALLAESDAKNTSMAGRITSFLSTLSLRRATAGMSDKLIGSVISIHALLAESDGRIVKGFLLFFEFLSTLSLRRATSLYAL